MTTVISRLRKLVGGIPSTIDLTANYVLKSFGFQVSDSTHFSKPLHTDASGAVYGGAIVLTTDVSGILPVANGGTGADNLSGFVLTANSNQSIAGIKTFTGAVALDCSVTLGSGQVFLVQTTPSDVYQAANKGYVDSLISGITWVNPTETFMVVTDASQAGAPPAGVQGASYVANNWGAGFTDGTIYWYNTAVSGISGTHFVAGNALVDGMRIVVTGTSAAGSFAGKENQIATYSSGSYTFTVPSDGNAVLIHEGYWANQAFTYESATSEWIQFTGTGQINAGIGLSKTGNTIDINLGAGVRQLPSDEVGLDIYINGALDLVDPTTGSYEGGASDTDAQLTVRVDGVTITVPSATNSLTVGSIAATQVSDFNSAVSLYLTGGSTSTVTTFESGGAITADINLGANSGLNTSSGLIIDTSIAGDGLTMAAGVLAVGAGVGLGLSIASDSIGIDPTATSGYFMQTTGSTVQWAEVNLAGVTYYEGNGITLTSNSFSVTPGTATYYLQTNGSEVTWADANGYADGVGTATLGSANAYTDSVGSSTLSSANSYADGVGTATLGSANAYTDSVGSSTLSSANSYADGVGTATLGSANAYADGVGTATLGSANTYAEGYYTSGDGITVTAGVVKVTPGTADYYLKTTGSTVTWASLDTSVTLQDAYVNGNTITTTSAEGSLAVTLGSSTDFTVDGVGALKVSAAGGLDMTTTSILMNGGSVYTATNASVSEMLDFYTGDVTAVSGAIGPIAFETGASDQAEVVGGDITFTTGDTTGSGAVSGNIIFNAGAAVSGRGQLQVNAGDAVAATMLLQNLDNLMLDMIGGVGEVTISLASNSGTYDLILPVDDGTTGQYLKTDGTGVLSWGTVDLSLVTYYDGDGITLTSNSFSVTPGTATYYLQTTGSTVQWADANGYADGVGTATLGSANAYTDSVGSSTLSSANSYADGVGTATLGSANAYADGVGTATLGSANAYTDAAYTDGYGLTLTSGVFAVGAGIGMTVAADSIGLTMTNAAAGKSLVATSASTTDWQFPVESFAAVAGEALEPDKTYAVRWALNGETGGRVYQATKDVAGSPGKYWVIGVVQTTASVSAGDAVVVVKSGLVNLKSADTNVGSTENGLPLFLQTIGSASNFSCVAPDEGVTAGSSYASAVIGMVSSYNATVTSTVIDVNCGPGSLMGIDVA